LSWCKKVECSIPIDRARLFGVGAPEKDDGEEGDGDYHHAPCEPIVADHGTGTGVTTAGVVAWIVAPAAGIAREAAASAA
jgi:hypothetical protein